VLRRCPTPLTMLVTTVACSLGLQPTFTRAASSSSSTSNVATYSWITSLNLPPITTQSTGPQIQFLVEPYGSLVYTPPTVNSAGVTTSPGISPLFGKLSVTPALDSSNSAVVAVKTGTDSNGQPEEFLGLAFANGLKAGSALQASLYYNTSQPPTLMPFDTPGISTPTISTNSSQASGTEGGGVTPDAHTPEPLSLLIWAVLAAGALARTRFLRPS
jgi:hypothetical protein